jgi:hypothetical protein
MIREIEDVILRYSERGMEDLRKYVSGNCCQKAADEILSWEKGNVFLATGFYVAGYAETDGPVGTVALAHALKKLGYKPIIVTDNYCKGFFELEDIDTVYIDIAADKEVFEKLISKYNPKGMISIERCGKNRFLDYANMRGISISEYTAPIDEMFSMYQGIIPTIGVGDGGNEIGMGKVSGVIRRKLSLESSIVSTDLLVIATVSNWGAYGIVTALGAKTGKRLMPDINWIEEYIVKTVFIGSVDGVTHAKTVTVDGKSMTIEKEIVTALQKIESGRMEEKNYENTRILQWKN